MDTNWRPFTVKGDRPRWQMVLDALPIDDDGLPMVGYVLPYSTVFELVGAVKAMPWDKIRFVLRMKDRQLVNLPGVGYRVERLAQDVAA